MLNKTEILVLLHLHNPENDLPEISKSQLYRIYAKLKKMQVIDINLIIKMPFLHKLLDLCEVYPKILDLLLGSNPVILNLFNREKTIRDVEFLSGYKKAYISRVVKLAVSVGVMSKNKNRYILNRKIDLGFVELLPLYLDVFRVCYGIPNNATVYFISDKEVLVSLKLSIEFNMTAYSRYDDYKLGLFGNENYYTSKQKLTIEDIFRHSLLVLEKNNDFKLKIMAMLFYCKNKSKLLKFDYLEFVKNTELVLSGNNVIGFPKLSELREKGEVYDIEL